jgi:hypothetical protein
LKLKEYIEKNETDRNLFYKLPSGECKNLLEEAIEILQSPGIAEYQKILISLIPCAETETQRENLNLLVELFKNKFKKDSKLNKFAWEIESAIYLFKSDFL